MNINTRCVYPNIEMYVFARSCILSGFGLHDTAFYRGFSSRIFDRCKGVKYYMKSASGKPSTDAKIIRAFMVSQPRSLESLETVTGVARETFRKRLVVLVKMNVVKEISEEEWAFKNYSPPEETVRRAMEYLLENGFTRFSSATVARVLNKQNPDLRGATPDEVAPIAWRLSSKLRVIMDEKAFFHNGHRVIF